MRVEIDKTFDNRGLASGKFKSEVSDPEYEKGLQSGLRTECLCTDGG